MLNIILTELTIERVADEPLVSAVQKATYALFINIFVIPVFLSNICSQAANQNSYPQSSCKTIVLFNA